LTRRRTVAIEVRRLVAPRATQAPWALGKVSQDAEREALRCRNNREDRAPRALKARGALMARGSSQAVTGGRPLDSAASKPPLRGLRLETHPHDGCKVGGPRRYNRRRRSFGTPRVVASKGGSQTRPYIHATR